MKKTLKLCTLLAMLAISVFMPTGLFAQDSVITSIPKAADSAKYVLEPSIFIGSGYMFDYSGSGGYTYACPGLMAKKGNMRWGVFTNTTKVYVRFNDYDFSATEFTIGPAVDGWGKLGVTRSYAFWAQPGFKIFRDHGHDRGYINEAWQNDYGFYGVFGANINDNLNRWFRSYKINIMYQKPFWSKRTGTIEGEKLNFKATNKTYFKVQAESTGKKMHLKRGRLEPKLVFGYLYDGGSKKDLFEYGTGLAFSFMKGDRYLEAFNLQYRLRYGTDFGRPFHVFEVGVDFFNLYQLWHL